MSSPMAAVMIAGLICGILDLTGATILFVSNGGSFVRLLQFIASGVLGASSFQGKWGAASLGFFLHFCISFAAATVYYFTSQFLSALLFHPVFFGMLFGAFLHLLMSLVAIPLSRAPRREFSMKAFVAQLFVHTFVVGLSISLTLSGLLK